MTKRDLSELCLEGLLESTEQQQQTQLAALLQVSLDCVIEGVFALKTTWLCLASSSSKFPLVVMPQAIMPQVW